MTPKLLTIERTLIDAGYNAAIARDVARIALEAMKPQSRAWPKARIAHLKALNATGMTFAEIGEEMGLMRSAVSGALYRLGIVGGSRFAQDRRSYSVGAMK